VVSALGEAFNNIALHAYRVGPAGPVQLSIEVFEDEIVFELEDHGCSHDPSAVRPPDLSALPESGMGLYIIRECMDSVEYVAGSPPDRPNLLRLRKRLGG
jgi:serine/threonine-protein kinase RsbW